VHTGGDRGFHLCCLKIVRPMLLAKFSDILPPETSPNEFQVSFLQTSWRLFKKRRKLVERVPQKNKSIPIFLSEKIKRVAKKSLDNPIIGQIVG